MRSALNRSLAAAGLIAALSLCAALARPAGLAAFQTSGESLGVDQRDFRVFDNFIDPQANDNTVPHPNFPGHTGAVMAIWKAHCEWGSGARAVNGLGDGLASNANIGDGFANFDNSFQGLAATGGGNNSNVHSSALALGGGVLGLTLTPVSDGWKILYNEDWTWDDGPGAAPEGTLDLQAVATHEIGHTLGLGHSTVPGATMSTAVSGDFSAARSIEADDQAGVQAIYGQTSGFKPRILFLSRSTDVGGVIDIHGLGFAPTNNEVWFTKADSDGTPTKVTGVSVSEDPQVIGVVIPADAAVGELLVKKLGGDGSSLSNAFPVDIGSPPGEFGLGVGSLASGSKLPQLTGAGDLSPGGAGFTVYLNLMPSSAPGLLFVSLNDAIVPFKGGQFACNPVLLQVPIATGAGGPLAFSASLPAATPPSFGFTLQAWFVDGAGIVGFSATNSLRLELQ